MRSINCKNCAWFWNNRCNHSFSINGYKIIYSPYIIFCHYFKNKH